MEKLMWEKMSVSMLAATSHMVHTWQLFKETNGDCHRNLSMHFLKKSREGRGTGEGKTRELNCRTQIQISQVTLRCYHNTFQCVILSFL